MRIFAFLNIEGKVYIKSFSILMKKNIQTRFFWSEF